MINFSLFVIFLLLREGRRKGSPEYANAQIHSTVITVKYKENSIVNTTVRRHAMFTARNVMQPNCEY